jgi:PAT family beta-lactamase induction signal transducer AmpG
MVGYRIGMIAAGGGLLALVSWFSLESGVYALQAWSWAYFCMALLMSVGVVTVLVITEPQRQPDASTLAQEQRVDRIIERQAWLSHGLQYLVEWFYGAVVSPFADFIRRYRWQAVLILALISTYRISDIVLGAISSVFYVDMEFSEAEVALYANFLGILMSLLGALVGGLMVTRFGVMRVLFLGGVLAAATNLLFAWLATVGHSVPMLALVICADNLSAGLATAAFVAYLSGLTNVSYSATQYALFSSIMLLLPKFLAGFSGVIVDKVDYVNFFLFTTSLGVPVLLLIALAMRYLPATGGKDAR